MNFYMQNVQTKIFLNLFSEIDLCRDMLIFYVATDLKPPVLDYAYMVSHLHRRTQMKCCTFHRCGISQRTLV